jgi:hypothetical protein
MGKPVYLAVVVSKNRDHGQQQTHGPVTRDVSECTEWLGELSGSSPSACSGEGSKSSMNGTVDIEPRHVLLKVHAHSGLDQGALDPVPSMTTPSTATRRRTTSLRTGCSLATRGQTTFRERSKADVR